MDFGTGRSQAKRGLFFTLTRKGRLISHVMHFFSLKSEHELRFWLQIFLRLPTVGPSDFGGARRCLQPLEFLAISEANGDLLRTLTV